MVHVAPVFHHVGQYFLRIGVNCNPNNFVPTPQPRSGQNETDSGLYCIFLGPVLDGALHLANPPIFLNGFPLANPRVTSEVFRDLDICLRKQRLVTFRGLRITRPFIIYWSGGATPAHGMRISCVEVGPAGGWCLSVRNAAKMPKRVSQSLQFR